jgi:hypothetical protein
LSVLASLIAPEVGKAGGGAQFKQFCALPLCNRECLMVTPLGRSSIANGIQQIASHPIQLSLIAPLIGGFNDLRSLGEAIQTLRRPS